MNDAAQNFREAFLAFLDATSRWVVACNPPPDVILAELERTVDQVRQMQAVGEVRPQ